MAAKRRKKAGLKYKVGKFEGRKDDSETMKTRLDQFDSAEG
jgi:hypothetical protein